MNDHTAITTKIKAMRGKLISEEDLQSLDNARSLNDVYQLLNRSSPYKEAFATFKFDPTDRTELELAIRRGIRYDFLKLYRFASMKQRPFLKTFAMQYENIVIKRALRNVVEHQMSGLIMDDFAEYLQHSRHFHMDEVVLATDVGGVVNALRDTEYAQLFADLAEYWTQTSYQTYEIESAIDTFIEMAVWKGGKKYLSAKEALGFRKTFGAQFDLINILTIYRLKFYYHLPIAEIQASLFDIRKKLTPEVIDQLLLAPDKSAYQSLLVNLGYKKLTDALTNATSISKAMHEIIDELLRRAVLAQPNSMIAIIAYLIALDNEQERIIQIIERISTANMTNNRKELA